MDNPTPVAATDDLSALAWVHEELRKTLESAHRSLRRYLRDAEASRHSDLDDVEPTILRGARQQLHQGVGALELVNMPEGALLLRASEAAVQRFIGRSGRLDAGGVEAIEHASFALLDYIGRRLGGKPAPAVALFPQLRALLELNGAERIHPADLWSYDWRWREVAAPLTPTAAGAPKSLQADFERRLLVLVRSNSPEAAAALAQDCVRVAQDCAASGDSAQSSAPVTFWRIAAAFFEAWGLGLLPSDLFVKRSASRVMAQLRARGKGDLEVSDRLAQDLLFYCARALLPEGAGGPWLSAVRQAYRLPDEPALDYSTPFYGRHDPAQIAQARKRVVAAKDAWNGVAAGELHRLDSLFEAFSLVGDSIRRLYPAGGHLAEALSHAAVHTARLARSPAAPLAMEVATSLLYLEAALEEAEFDQPGQASRAERLAQRIGAAAAGEPPQSLEPWMEELYRRVSDRQTMGSVVHELRASLSEVERQIDQFFRNPRESGLLVAVPGQLVSMRGVLSVLGVDAAVQASARMREDVEHLLHDEVDPQDERTLVSFQRLAGNLGALGFLIDMLSVQPQMARSLFRFDASTGILAPVMGRSAMAPDLIDRAHAIAAAVHRDEVPLQALSEQIDALSRERQVKRQPALQASLTFAQQALERTDDSARSHVAQALNEFVATATSPLDLEPVPAPSLISRPIPLHPEEPATFVQTGLEDDQEMRDIFLEESRDVLAQAQGALAMLAEAPSDVAQLTTVRRAFHTLKGSSRMVGLAPFGEAAWACEQLYNHWLAEQTPASPELRSFTGDALQYFSGWVEGIAAHDEQAFAPEPVIAAADALRLAGELMRVPLPQAEVIPMLTAFPEEAHDVQTLDLEVPSVSPMTPVLEPLQATRPLELTPTWDEAYDAQRAAAALGPELIDEALDLDLDGEVAEPPPLIEGGVDLAIDLPLDLPSPELTLAASDAEMPALEVPPQDLPTFEVPPALPPLDDWALAADGGIERIEVDVVEPPEGSSDSWRAPLETRTSHLEGLDSGASELPSVLPEHLLSLDELVEPVAAEPAAVDLATGVGDEALPAVPLPTEPPELPARPEAAGAQVIRLEDFRPSSAGVDQSVVDDAALPPLEGRAEGHPEEDEVKVIGPLRLQIPLFNIYLNEADELSRRLTTQLAEWSLEQHRPVGGDAVALAHSLAGSSFTVGFQDLAQLARDLEHALALSDRIGSGLSEDALLFSEVADEIRRLLHQFAAGFLRSPPEELQRRLHDWQADASLRPQRPLERSDEMGWSDSGDLALLDGAADEAGDLLPLPEVQSLAGPLDLDLAPPTDIPTDIPVEPAPASAPVDLDIAGPAAGLASWPTGGVEAGALHLDPSLGWPWSAAAAQPGATALPTPATGVDTAASRT
ncbi:MAG TPA: Hpt domain-containing protein, partial [Burkholderiaceae bacterium]|nr:Hpt domain-containing protein [Burkholderiaceae bacterium]